MAPHALSREAFEGTGLIVTAMPLPGTIVGSIAAVAVDLDRAHAGIPRAFLSGLHNPWGPGAHVVDSWRLLDVCEHPSIVDLVAEVVGPDLVLWDSELRVRPTDRGEPDGWQGPNPSWPIEPLAGATVRLAVDRALVLQYRPGSHRSGGAGTPSESVTVVVPAGHAALADVSLLWRYEPAASFASEFAIRYMPATSRYNRDPLSAANKIGTRTAPLINYSLRPLWLVRGEDSGGNDFVTGFGVAVPSWSPAPW